MLQNKNDKQIKRLKLSKASFIKWLRTRYHNENRTNNHYLYFPQELMQETSYQKIFKEIDFDGSGGLSREEMLIMFNRLGIPITMDDLNKLYDSLQPELEEMDCQMFKKCALSQKPVMVFREIVQNLGQGYLPHNFTNMVIYLVYLSKRQELKKGIEEQKMPIKNKIENVESLLKLKNLEYNNQRLTNHAEGFKHHIRIKFRNIWEKINQKYGEKYPFTQKLQEEFFQYYRHQKP